MTSLNKYTSYKQTRKKSKKIVLGVPPEKKP